MELISLPFKEWHRVEPIVTGEFQNAMPRNPQADTFVTYLDGERVAAFLHVETLYHFNSLYVAPEYRDKKVGPRLFVEALRGITPGFSAIVMADRRNWQHWAHAVGARDLGLCRILRKDRPYHEQE